MSHAPHTLTWRTCLSDLCSASAAAVGESEDAAPASASASAASAAAAASAAPSAVSSAPRGFRKGAIVRVKMLNFMIYDDEEVWPGAGLNLLLGPNGSGQQQEPASAAEAESGCES